MDIWIDSADVGEIEQAVSMNLCDGVTTNPTLIAKTGKANEQVIREICKLTEAPVLAETVGISHQEIITEGRRLAAIATNVVIKIPMSKDGLRAVWDLQGEEIETCVTLIFNAGQALLAAKAGASYIAPFVGRLDDISADGMELIQDIVDIYDRYEFPTQVIVASVRGPLHIKNAALAGAHAITVPFALLDKLMAHPLTDAGIAKFLADAQKAK